MAPVVPWGPPGAPRAPQRPPAWYGNYYWVWRRPVWQLLLGPAPAVWRRLPPEASRLAPEASGQGPPQQALRELCDLKKISGPIFDIFP